MFDFLTFKFHQLLQDFSVYISTVCILQYMPRREFYIWKQYVKLDKCIAAYIDKKTEAIENGPRYYIEFTFL